MQHAQGMQVQATRKSKNSLKISGLDEFYNIGISLKEQREKRKINLEQAASCLKIRPYYLKSLEEGKFSNIPGKIYVDGYIQNYADFLGLDSDMLVARYRGSGGRHNHRDSYMPPELSNDDMKPGRRILWIALALLLLVYSVWYISDRRKAEVVQNTHETIIEPDKAPSQTSKALDARVVILAKSDVEMAIIGADGTPLYKNLMHSGETYFVPNDGLILKTPTPEGLQIFVDGESVSPTGKTVVTEAGILLDPNKLLENSGYTDTEDAVE